MDKSLEVQRNQPKSYSFASKVQRVKAIDDARGWGPLKHLSAAAPKLKREINLKNAASLCQRYSSSLL